MKNFFLPAPIFQKLLYEIGYGALPIILITIKFFGDGHGQGCFFQKAPCPPRHSPENRMLMAPLEVFTVRRLAPDPPEPRLLSPLEVAEAMV